jgi:peptidoglycan/LPS O-acetylase OafA/YrhL
MILWIALILLFSVLIGFAVSRYFSEPMNRYLRRGRLAKPMRHVFAFERVAPEAHE